MRFHFWIHENAFKWSQFDINICHKYFKLWPVDIFHWSYFLSLCRKTQPGYNNANRSKDSQCKSGHCCGVWPFKRCRACCDSSHWTAVRFEHLAFCSTSHTMFIFYIPVLLAMDLTCATYIAFKNTRHSQTTTLCCLSGLRKPKFP